MGLDGVPENTDVIAEFLVCICGHSAVVHTIPEDLREDSLLPCTKCDCDHFQRPMR